jgi:hypothetical protein
MSNVVKNPKPQLKIQEGRVTNLTSGLVRLVRCLCSLRRLGQPLPPPVPTTARAHRCGPSQHAKTSVAGSSGASAGIVATIARFLRLAYTDPDQHMLPPREAALLVQFAPPSAVEFIQFQSPVSSLEYRT